MKVMWRVQYDKHKAIVFDSLHARLITRILETDPKMNNWIQYVF